MKFSKRILSIFLALLIFISVNLTPVSAVTSVSADTKTYTSGDYQYKILDDGTIEITDYFGNDTDLVIPSTIDGYIVTKIGERAFSLCESLISVTIPGNIKNIGARAFFICYYLKNVNMLFGVEVIGEHAFDCCENLQSITLPKSLKIIGRCAFGECRSLQDIVIPESVIELGYEAFFGCENLGKVTIPSNIKIIEDFAFSGCFDLTEVIIENGVETIDACAFQYCQWLSKVKIPESVTTINQNAFLTCYSLNKIVIPATVTEMSECGLGWWADGISGKVKNFTIYGYLGTAGEEYAVENEFEFIPLDKGDADESTAVDINDVTCMQKIIAKITATNDFKTANCDLNGDGKLNIRDATLLQLFLAKKIDKFPVQE